jgi:hypothetical protein
VSSSENGLTKEQIIEKYPPKTEPFESGGQTYSPRISRDENDLIRYIEPGWGKKRIVEAEKEDENER